MSAIASILVGAGADFLGGLIRRRGGASGEILAPIAEKGIREIATRLNLPEAATADVDMLEEAIASPDVTGVSPAKVETVVRQVNDDLAAQYGALVPIVESYHRLLESDAKSESWIARHWRPVNGWLFGIECGAVVATVCVAILWQIPLAAALMPLVSLVVPVMGLQAGVAGYYQHLRTREKMAGAAGA